MKHKKTKILHQNTWVMKTFYNQSFEHEMRPILMRCNTLKTAKNMQNKSNSLHQLHNTPTSYQKANQ
jgi:hypothetical protein